MNNLMLFAFCLLTTVNRSDILEVQFQRLFGGLYASKKTL